MTHPGFKKLIFVLLCAALCPALNVWAGFIDFEDGWDGSWIRSSITGLQFTSNEGYGWVYGDWRTDLYYGPYPNQAVVDSEHPLSTQYYSDGNFFAWMGTDEGTGIITFTQAYATYFEVGYSTWGGLKVTAYDDLGLILDEQEGVSANVGTGQMDYIRVNGAGMKMIKISGVHNKWLIDNLKTDAVQQCTEDAHCDDGNVCNGQESCVDFQCVDGASISCLDDGVFCNGTESCDASLGCVHSGNPCTADQVCDEDKKECVTSTDDDTLSIDDDSAGDDDNAKEPSWPKGKVTGGCCGD
jgi:hypothetical protein